MPVTFAIRGRARGALAPSVQRRLRRRGARMAAAAALAEGTPAFDVGLVLTDDDEIHALNRAWRKKDRPTDVLAFAMREGEGGALHPGALGDVVISVETAARQKRRRRLEDEIFFLWSHGLCHLLGYDHRTDAEEAEMNARMATLRAEGARRGRVRPA
ncbi:MAG TPA: rRNA maturation RNase YbeY [Haliangiales bacterium]|nr:rRNA maturation RNase YbeY [Haliangiales bacterium]